MPPESCASSNSNNRQWQRGLERDVTKHNCKKSLIASPSPEPQRNTFLTLLNNLLSKWSACLPGQVMVSSAGCAPSQGGHSTWHQQFIPRLRWQSTGQRGVMWPIHIHIHTIHKSANSLRRPILRMARQHLAHKHRHSIFQVLHDAVDHTLTSNKTCKPGTTEAHSQNPFSHWFGYRHRTHLKSLHSITDMHYWLFMLCNGQPQCATVSTSMT